MGGDAVASLRDLGDGRPAAGRGRPAPGRAWAAYAAALGFALVYLGEHYVTDLLAGAALVALVRRGEPLVEPLVEAVNGVLQRLERVAASPAR